MTAENERTESQIGHESLIRAQALANLTDHARTLSENALALRAELAAEKWWRKRLVVAIILLFVIVIASISFAVISYEELNGVAEQNRRNTTLLVHLACDIASGGHLHVPPACPPNPTRSTP